MDTKELVERLRGYKKAELSTPSEYAKGWNDARFNLVQVAHETADAIERLERELAENIAARNDFAKDWDAAHNRAEAVESELATLRARMAKMEEALRAAEDHIVGMYRGIVPHANYDNELIAGLVLGNRMADADSCVKMLRAALTEEPKT